MIAANNKGFSMVEMILAILITLVIVGSISLAYRSALRSFTDIKAVSDTIESKSPSLELLARYFDRWGVGVVSQADCATAGVTCTALPAAKKTMTLTTTNGCSDITFFGNLYGYGFVQGVSGGTANIVSCRLSTNSNQNCYVIWRSDGILASAIDGNYILPVGLSSLSSNNADCSQFTGSPAYNVTADSTLSTIPVQTGDIIQRVPHAIRLYCANNSNDGNRNWLYVDRTDQSNDYCNDNEPSMPIAPVDSFTATALPSGCSLSGGTCSAVQVTATFRSQSKKYTGQYDTYTVTRVFGR